MDRIAIMVAYFGVMPEIYWAWEMTARANETIDFFVFTDSKKATTRDNIRVIATSFEDFKEMIQKKFNFKIALRRPYKLCDYKPTYGLVFQEILQEYDWWGYCDIDLLLGDIRKFFNDECLKKHDRCQLLGHLCIYRNNAQMNALCLYREEKWPALNYDEVYQTEESMYFDEARGMYTKGLLAGVNVFVEQSFRDPVECGRKFYHKKIDKNNQFVVLWQDGKCWSVDINGTYTELLYAHFYRRQFEVVNYDQGNIQTIKVVPRRVIFNSYIKQEDYEETERFFYKFLYYLRIMYNSMRRYGIRRTIERQKWSKAHNKYIEDVERKVIENNE